MTVEATIDPGSEFDRMLQRTDQQLSAALLDGLLPRDRGDLRAGFLAFPGWRITNGEPILLNVIALNGLDLGVTGGVG